MPRKYKPRKTKNTRRVRKPRKKNNDTLMLVKNPSVGGFPRSVFTRLKYVLNGALNPGVVGINDVLVLRANSVYDPTYATGGSQPRGFDQWSALYDHVYVKRCRILVEFHNGDATNEVQCGIAIRDDYPSESTALEYMEQNCVHGMLGRVGSSHNHLRLTKTFDYARQNYKKYTDSANKHDATSNPSEVGYFHIWCGSPWSQDATNTYYTITMYYDVLFTELKDIPQS